MSVLNSITGRTQNTPDVKAKEGAADSPKTGCVLHGRTAALILQRLGFCYYLRKPAWYFRIHILLLPSHTLISIQPAFIPDIDIPSLATRIHANAIEIIHDRSLTHGPSA